MSNIGMDIDQQNDIKTYFLLNNNLKEGQETLDQLIQQVSPSLQLKIQSHLFIRVLVTNKIIQDISNGKHFGIDDELEQNKKSIFPLSKLLIKNCYERWFLTKEEKILVRKAKRKIRRKSTQLLFNNSIVSDNLRP